MNRILLIIFLLLIYFDGISQKIVRYESQANRITFELINREHEVFVLILNCGDKPIYYFDDYLEIGSICKDDSLDECYIVNSVRYYDSFDNVKYELVKLGPSETKHYLVPNPKDKKVAGIYFHYTRKEISIETGEISDFMEVDIVE